MYLFKIPYHQIHFRMTTDLFYSNIAKYRGPQSTKEVEEKNEWSNSNTK